MAGLVVVSLSLVALTTGALGDGGVAGLLLAVGTYLGGLAALAVAVRGPRTTPPN